MPLRQSRLKFANQGPRPTTNFYMSDGKLSETCVVTLCDDRYVDADTIVVDVSKSNHQLPTPSESATDVSSQSSTTDCVKDLPKISSKRVINARKSKFREESVDGPGTTGDEKNRSVSGETLVSKASESSLLRTGIKALDMDWSVDNAVSETAMANKDNDVLNDVIEIDPTFVMRVNHVEDEAEKTARLAARKARMEQNAKLWEKRCKAAEKNATRRSGRASLVLEKAGDVISGITSGILGKRARDGDNDAEKTSSKTQRETVTATEPATKKLRFTEQDKPLPPLPKKTQSAKDKKWLVSGLYAGQVRSFDARLTESGNKKKSNVKDSSVPAKENSVLPLPMFAGERLLKQGREFKLPFDIYSPVPYGQAKPEGWRKQNRNVIIGDAADIWRSNRVQESSKCMCREEIGCDHNCLNRTMYYECDNNNCNISASMCTNRQWRDLAERMKLSMAFTIGVDVVKTADRGHGVRANRTFEPGQIILEYTGEIITQEECERRMRTDYKTNECYYLMLFDQNMILDATRGSMARFVNHSCEPNCTMEKWTVNGVPRMALFAGDRGIMTGEELTYDYNFDPYSQKNVQECRCGSAKCRGFLGPRPKDVKQKSPDADGPKKKPEGKIAGAKRKIAEVLGESTTGLNKKSKTETSKPSKAAGKTKQSKTQSPKKVIAVKKVAKKKVTIIKGTTKSIKKRESTLKKIITDTKKKATVVKGKRVISTGSMKEALLPKAGKTTTKPVVGRSSSLKEKAANLRKAMSNSVRSRGK